MVSREATRSVCQCPKDLRATFVNARWESFQISIARNAGFGNNDTTSDHGTLAGYQTAGSHSVQASHAEASAQLERKRSLVLLSDFLPAAAQAVHSGAHAGAIPQDITSSCAKISVPDGNDLSTSSAKKKIYFFFGFSRNCLTEAPL